MTLLHRSEGGSWVRIEAAEYRDERDLHDLLVDNPQILPIDDLAEAESTTMAAVGYETELGSGYADALFLSTDGRLTIVEVKLRRNAEVRREVVAQALSYAAYVEGMSIDEFRHQVIDPFLRKFDHTELIDRSLPQVVEDLSGSEIDGDTLTSNLAAQLQGGDFRILIAVDEIHPQLRKSVSYVNRHARFDLYLVEVGYFRSASGREEILSPRMLDVTVARTKPPGSRRDWTIESYLDQASERAPKSASAMRALYDGLLGLEDEGLVTLAFGTGATASLRVWVAATQKSILWVWSNGEVTLARRPLPELGVDPDLVESLIDRVANVSGINPARYSRDRPEPKVVGPDSLHTEGLTEVILEVVREAATAAADVGPTDGIDE